MAKAERLVLVTGKQENGAYAQWRVSICVGRMENGRY